MVLQEFKRQVCHSSQRMGTARMGASAETSACDSDVQCWDAQGLYLTYLNSDTTLHFSVARATQSDPLQPGHQPGFCTGCATQAGTSTSG